MADFEVIRTANGNYELRDWDGEALPRYCTLITQKELHALHAALGEHVLEEKPSTLYVRPEDLADAEKLLGVKAQERDVGPSPHMFKSHNVWVDKIDALEARLTALERRAKAEDDRRERTRDLVEFLEAHPNGISSKEQS